MRTRGWPDAWLPEPTSWSRPHPTTPPAWPTGYGLAVATIPNAVRRPASVTSPPGHARILYVGNLTYRPNVDAVRDLIERRAPCACASRSPTPRSISSAPMTTGSATSPRTTGCASTGWVPDVAPYYAGADVVVVPLREGAGTRIKVLEAFAHRTAGGRDAGSGRRTRGARRRVGRAWRRRRGAGRARPPGCCARPSEARRLVGEASAVLSAHYLLDVVAPSARRLIFGAA